jgi:hypothetical protein
VLQFNAELTSIHQNVREKLVVRRNGWEKGLSGIGQALKTKETTG